MILIIHLFALIDFYLMIELFRRFDCDRWYSSLTTKSTIELNDDTFEFLSKHTACQRINVEADTVWDVEEKEC